MSLVGAEWWRGSADDEVALRDETEALTWSQFDGLLNRTVSALLARELGSDRRVAVYAENSATTAVAYLTSVLAGCSAVPVSYLLRAEECAYILRDSGAALLFTGPENVDRALAAATDVGSVVVVAWGVEPRAGLITWEQFLSSGSDAEPPTDLRPLPYLHYTSGTTGFPKGAITPPGVYPRSDAATVAEHVAALAANVPHDQGPQLTVAPLYHSGQLYVIKGALLAGRSLIILRRFDAERTLETIERYRVGRMQLVPTHFVRLLALPAEVRDRYDLSSIRMISHSGAPCPVDVKRRMIEWLGPVIYEAYGATEQGTISGITSEEWLAHPGSVGKVRKGLELRVIGEDDAELGPNQVGRLYVRDISGFDVSFHNDPEKTASVHLNSGLFTIGEVGYLDEDGYLYLTDRFSDTVISGGVNIFPAESEQVIADHPEVADVACIGVADPDLGEVLRALVVPRDPESPPSEAEIIDYVQGRLSKYKCPRSVEFVADLGRNALGKLNKRELRQRYAEGEIAPVGLA